MRKYYWTVAVLSVVACAEMPVGIPPTEPGELVLRGVAQCTKEGSTFPSPVRLELTNVDGDPVGGTDVVIATTGATFDNASRDVRQTDGDGVIELQLRADSLSDVDGAVGHATIDVYVRDRRWLGASGELSVARRAWLTLLEPDSTRLCRGVDREWHVVLACTLAVAWGCGIPEQLPDRVYIEADERQQGVFERVGDFMVGAGGLAEGHLDVTLRTWDITVRARDPMGVAPNSPSFVISRCGGGHPSQ